MNDRQLPQSVDSALARATARLHPSSTAALDAQVLLGAVLKCSRGWLLGRGESLIAPEKEMAFERLVERRAGGEPLAYLTGRREFWSQELAVSPAVLVPRPETELVVERALALFDASRTAAIDVADLGTGSGAIALALARDRPRWQITATDDSAPALALARANAQTLGLENVRFRAGDWFQALAGECFQLLVSNPPYLADHDPALRDPALRHEPRMALASGATGLEDLGRLINGAAAHLSPGGWLVLEHGATQAQAVADLLVAQGFRHVRCHSDLAGWPRVSEAQWPAPTPSTA